MTRYSRTLSVFALFFCLAGVSLAQELPRYVIHARIDPQARRISASQTVTFTNNTAKETPVVYFHIYANRLYTPQERAFILRYASYFNVNPFPRGFEKTTVDISRLGSGGRELDFSVEGQDKTLLKVSLPQALGPGQSITLDLDFSVNIPVEYGRYGSVEGVMALSRWYPVLSVYDDNGWENHPFYPFHRPFHSESAHYDVELTVPSNEVVIHSANLVKEDSSANGQKTLHITTDEPIREFSLAMSRDYQLVEENHDAVAFKVFYLPGPGRKARAQEAMRNSENLMDYYSKRFGPYPYKTFSIAPVHLGYGGEQMSNMIFIDTRVFDLPKLLHRYFDFLIAHETGHQWFYDLVGTNDFTQMWMEEGFNSYFLLHYLMDKYGANAQVVDFQRLPRWVKLFLPDLTFRRGADVRYKMMSRIGLEDPIISKLSSFNEPSNIFALTYGKGSRVVDMLRTSIGDEAFDRVFNRIFKEYRFRNLDIEDFMRIAKEESKQDLDGFFQQWLYTTKHLDVRVDGVRANQIFLSRHGGVVMPVDVDITYKNGQQETAVWDGRKEKDVLSTNMDVEKAVLDPRQKLLDIDRPNNTWPRHVHFIPVPLYHPLYDIPALMPDDDYNLIMGPEISNGIGLKASFQKPYDYHVTAATDYDFGDKIQRSRIGAEVTNVLHSQTTVGIEEQVTNDYDNGEDDLVSNKVYLRRELWPMAYGLTDVNDHITLYALRNRTPTGATWLGQERLRDTSYLRRNESIVGTILHFDRSRPRPDPQAGYTIDTLIENSGHSAGATQTFTRASIDYQIYQSVTPLGGLFANTIYPNRGGGDWGIGNWGQMAYRVKYGWGSSHDKNLWELGGADGLRGYNLKAVRGAEALMGQAEYRFPICDELRLSVADHWLNLHKITGVAFFDGGQAWYDSFKESKFLKDAGLGLRLHVSLGSLEDIIVRLDVAQAINDRKDPHVWAGINHAF